MKALTSPEWSNRRNAWGNFHDVCTQDFKVEPDDVGKTRLHYLGRDHRDYTFTSTDVGRTITVMTDKSSWTCWSFKT